MSAPKELAGKFCCHVPRGYARQANRILYIGKATAGPFLGRDAARRSFNGVSAFWSFARSISQMAGGDPSTMSNLAWTNIFKQGVVRGNPKGELAARQRILAEQMLRGEVTSLNPNIIVLVNANYYEEIPKAAFSVEDGEAGDLSLRRRIVPNERFDLWSRKSVGKIPPIVWLYHPQGKSKQYLEAARDLISEMTGWSSDEP